jgi:hypothetical protein
MPAANAPNPNEIEVIAGQPKAGDAYFEGRYGSGAPGLSNMTCIGGPSNET